MSNAVTIREDGQVGFSTLQGMLDFGAIVSRSGFAPKGMEKPEAIAIAVQHGLELGLAPMQALQSIAVVNGRPAIYGDAALALVRASGLCERYEQELLGQGDARKAVVTSHRKGDKKPLSTEFSVADAKRAGLWGKQGPWTQYSDRMLVFRARGFNLRDNFGDILKGLRTAEELRDERTSERNVTGEATSRVVTAEDMLGGKEEAPQAESDETATTEDAGRALREKALNEFAAEAGATPEALAEWLHRCQYIAEPRAELVGTVEADKAIQILETHRARAAKSLRKVADELEKSGKAGTPSSENGPQGQTAPADASEVF